MRHPHKQTTRDVADSSALPLWHAEPVNRTTHPAMWLLQEVLQNARRHPMNRSQPFPMCNSTLALWCFDDPLSSSGRLLKGSVFDKGLGNRLANVITFSALGAMLGRAVVTTWPNAEANLAEGGGGRRFYGGIDELRALMQMPEQVLFIEHYLPPRNSSHGRHPPMSAHEILERIPLNEADKIPTWMVKHFEYGWGHPEGIWFYWQTWAIRGAWPPPSMNHAEFVAGVRRVCASYRPRRDLDNPTARSYLALHVRTGGDKGSGDKGSVQDSTANLTARLAGRVSERSGLPWVVISDSLESIGVMEDRVREHGGRIATRTRSSIEWRLVKAHRNQRPAIAHSLEPTVRDFFALSASAGVLVSTPNWGSWIDSTYSSMAAIVGNVPVLHPMPTAAGGNIAVLQALGNASHEPLGDYFFADQLELFMNAVEQCKSRPFGTAKPLGVDADGGREAMNPHAAIVRGAMERVVARAAEGPRAKKKEVVSPPGVPTLAKARLLP